MDRTKTRHFAWVALAVLLAVPLWSVNAAPADPAEVVVCPPNEALKRLEDYNTNLNAELAQKQIPILNEMRALGSKAQNPSLPVGAQLTKADQDRFQQLREQLLALRAQETINSGYLRDSRVISRAAKVAYDLSQGRTFDEKDPDYFYYAVVGLLAIEHPHDQADIATPKDGECSIEAGLHFDEKLLLREIDRIAPSFKEATGRLTVIAQRFGLDTKQEGWVEKIPNLQDQQAARRDMGTVIKGQQLLGYLDNLENLKDLARVSILGFQSDTEDLRVAHTEAELSKVGTGWAERAKGYDERTQVLGGLLNMIAQKVPSDSAIEAQAQNKALREQGVIR
jgi:hypothetical protein